MRPFTLDVVQFERTVVIRRMGPGDVMVKVPQVVDTKRTSCLRASTKKPRVRLHRGNSIQLSIFDGLFNRGQVLVHVLQDVLAMANFVAEPSAEAIWSMSPVAWWPP